MNKDLEFLHFSSKQELQALTDYIIKDKHGKLRLTEFLSSKLTYNLNYPDHLAIMWKDIADELSLFGGNTILNYLSGHGTDYRTMLIELCKKTCTKFNKQDSTPKIEEALLRTTLIMSLEKLNQKLLENMLNEIKISHQKFSKHEMISVLKIAIERGAFPAHRIGEIVDNAISIRLVGRGVAFATALNRSIYVLAGPLGWVIYAVLTITGPAYRVTFPAVVKIATMRSKLYYESGKSTAMKERLMGGLTSGY